MLNNFKNLKSKIKSYVQEKNKTYIGYTKNGKLVKGSLKKVINTPDIEDGTIDIEI